MSATSRALAGLSLATAVGVVACQNTTPAPNAISATSESAPPKATEKPQPTAPPSATPSVGDSAAPSAPPPMPSSFPAIDDTCAVDADCTSTGLWGDCCGHCEMRTSNTSYVARANRYCGAHPAKCPPMACSWGMGKPVCKAGHCVAWK